jgi:hypothetical protein
MKLLNIQRLHYATFRYGRFTVKKLSFLLTSFFAILLTILSSIVPGERTEHYSDILGCVPKC